MAVDPGALWMNRVYSNCDSGSGKRQLWRNLIQLLPIDGLCGFCRLLIPCTSAFVLAFSGTSLDVAAETVPSISISSATLVNLPPELEQIATIIGALPVMRRIYQVQSELRLMRPGLSLEYMDARQKLIYQRQRLIEILQSANLQVNSSRGRIEREMAEMHLLRARMVDENARTLRRNTIINFISGGITKIAGYSIALGTTDTPSNILEVFDGSVQCALSGLVFKQLQSESESVKEIPDLISVLDENRTTQSAYPEYVWEYLCEKPPGSTSPVTRRAQLVSHWESQGIASRREKATRLREKGAFPNGVSLARMAPQLLDDREAMLFELRATITVMHHGLMLLSDINTKSYNDDPTFD